jgi:hypothetical protein
MADNLKAPIKVKRSKIHSTGVFASRDIKKGEKIIEYIGDKITKAEGDRRANIIHEKAKKNKKRGAVYLFELNKKFDIDGNIPSNKARFINHSCAPNCEAAVSRGHIWISAIKDIEQGEELTYDYGYRFDDTDWWEHPCRCGAKNCVGYIVDSEDWPKLKKALKKNKKK